MLLNDEIIYDECNASITDSSEAEVERGVQVTPAEWARKRELLLRLCDTRLSGAVFSLAKKHKVAENKIEILLLTKDGASLNVSLFKYSNGLCYLCTRGSPTKILSGQNVLPVRDSREVLKLRNRLQCTDFEAKSVLGFYMISKCCKSELGIGNTFYTDAEVNALDTLNISIYSLTFATYRSFGRTREERDFNLRLLSRLAVWPTSIGDTDFLLVNYLKVRAKIWKIEGDDTEDGHVVHGKHTGVMFQRTRPDGRILAKQVYYLKEDEIEAKTNSGQKNREMVLSLPTKLRKDLRDRLVRVDNTFGKEYIKEWLKALTKKEHKDITIRDANPLCDSVEFIAAMATMATNDLGLRVLLLGPTIADIRKIEANEDSDLSEGEMKILKEWLLLEVDTAPSKTGKGAKLNWTNITSNSMPAWRLNQKLMTRHYFDLRLPFAFYQALNAARADMFVVGKGRQALDADRNNDAGLGSFREELGAIKNVSIEKARELVGGIRNVFVLPTERTKESIVSDISNAPVEPRL
jgi:hypothetical protein